MAAMNHDVNIEELIRQKFLAHKWLGAVPIEEAIASVIAYRCNLNDADRAVFDEEVQNGSHPSTAVETVELWAGRLPANPSERRHKSLTTVT
jgi:hypothetical protein